MTRDEKQSNKTAAQDLGKLIEAFGAAVSKVFDDPELKQKAKEFGKSAAASAETFGKRLSDDEVKEKFKEVGKAAEQFGKSVSEHFKEK
jgi:[ribosomal protein S5]-alanine N-acetyltransferase